MSQSGSLRNNSGGGGGTPITQIDGDIGHISGSTVTIYANQATNNSGQTVEFVGNNSTVMVMNVTDTNGNTTVGRLAGNTALVGDGGTNNTSLGLLAGASLGEAGSCTLIGKSCGASMTADANQSGFGAGCLALANNGQGNSGFGFNCLLSILSGSYNSAFGSGSGSSYTGSESSNILLSNAGVLGESNVMRLGTAGSGAGEVNKAFIAAITGVTVAASAPVAVNSLGQMSSLGFGTSTQVLTSNGAGNSPTWQPVPSGASTTSFSVAMTTGQTIANNTLSKIVYDTTLIDTASGYASGVYTVPVGGTGNWFLSLLGNFTSGVSFIDCDIFLYKNVATTPVFLMHIQPSTPSDGATVNNGSGSGLFPLVAGDTLQIDVFAQTTGGGTFTATGSGNGFYNIFSGYKLS